MKNIDKGDVLVKLNHKARFFSEDIPYGLVILKDIGNIVGVPTPNMTKCIIFHQQYMDVKYVDPATGEFIPEGLATSGAPSTYGIKTLEQLTLSSIPKRDVSNNFYFR